MTAIVRSAVLASAALDIYPASVSVIVMPGQDGFAVTGCPAADAGTLRDRLRSALLNSGFSWPSGVAIRVTTDAPSVLEPIGLDLAIAVAILVTMGDVPAVPDSAAFLAELGLDGALRRGRPPEVLALDGPVSHVLVAPGAARDIADVTGLTVVGCLNLGRVVRWLRAADACGQAGS